MREEGSAGSGRGRRVSQRLWAIGAFWYDFIVGDDWRGAAAVALALAATALLTHVAGVNAWWLLPACVVAALGWSLRRAAARDEASVSPGRAP